MKAICKLLRVLLLAAFFVVGFAAKIVWRLAVLACAYLAVRRIARTQIRKALA